MNDIKSRSIQSGLWSVCGSWVSRLIGLLKLVILARFLDPKDFGLIGLAILSISVLKVFSETGIESALIQRSGIGRKEMDCAWTISVFRGAFLFVVLYLVSGVVSSYFGSPALKPILRVISIVFLIDGSVNIGIVLFKKELNFKKDTLIVLWSDVLASVATIILAFTLKNVWALVIGTLIWALVRAGLSYAFHPYRPKLYWNTEQARDLIGFGKHIFWISVVTFIVTSGDDALVGKILGLEFLGYYTMAYTIANIPVTNIAGIVGKISFSAYSSITEDPQSLKRAFRQIFEITLSVLFPITVMVILLSRDFILIFLGEKWLPMCGILQILCLLGLFRGLSNLIAPIHLAVNRPNIQSKNKTIELLVFLVLLYPFTVKWGLMGAAVAVTLVYFIGFLLNIVSTGHLIENFSKVLFIALRVPVFASLVLALAIFSVHAFSGETHVLMRFLMSACAGAFAFGGIFWALRRDIVYNVVRELK